jgi:GTPase SAR1 family protein
MKTLTQDTIYEPSPLNLFVSEYQNRYFEWWDFSGNPKYVDLRRSFYKFFHGYVLVFDMSNRNSFKNLKKWEKEIRPFVNESGAPTIIVGTKQDKGVSEKLNRTFTIVSQGKLIADDWEKFFAKVALTDSKRIKELNDGQAIPGKDRESILKKLPKIFNAYKT